MDVKFFGCGEHHGLCGERRGAAERETVPAAAVAEEEKEEVEAYLEYV